MLKPTLWICGLLLVASLLPGVARAQPQAADWPEGCDPREVGTLLVENLLARPPFASKGIEGAIHYSESCTYLGALRFAQATGQDGSLQKLLDRLDQLLMTVDFRMKIPYAWHVDTYMFGAVPLQAYLADGDRHYLVAGKNYADKQWRDARPDGLTKQTRFWIDDMFMVGVLQAQAHRATGDEVYADRAARQLLAYAERLQQPNGLFHHGEDSTRFWGRGNGWVAAGFTEVLRALPDDHPRRAELLDHYRRMMKGLLEYQGEDGMWRQLLDEPEVWAESSASAMFTYAFATGAREGWLGEEYADAARRGWTGLCDYIEPNGDVREVCVGTGQTDHRQYYIDRPRVTGDFHGQAAALWAATALVELDAHRSPSRP